MQDYLIVYARTPAIIRNKRRVIANFLPIKDHIFAVDHQDIASLFNLPHLLRFCSNVRCHHLHRVRQYTLRGTYLRAFTNYYGAIHPELLEGYFQNYRLVDFVVNDLDEDHGEVKHIYIAYCSPECYEDGKKRLVGTIKNALYVSWDIDDYPVNEDELMVTYMPEEGVELAQLPVFRRKERVEP
jgi:hypothetical protein